MTIDKCILRKYEFKDSLGHELEFCLEYIDMLNALEQAQGIIDWFYFFGIVNKGDIERRLSELGNSLKKLKWEK